MINRVSDVTCSIKNVFIFLNANCFKDEIKKCKPFLRVPEVHRFFLQHQFALSNSDNRAARKYQISGPVKTD